jgi:DNA-binding IclR family transcriptional regulator
MEQLRSVRNQGYAYDNQEEELLVRCLAVPIFNEGRPFAALGITATVSQIRPDNVEELATYLKRMSSQILR